ncbi:HD-GYP domain-containing protein [Bacillus thuringiensis]|uniref:HD-GYP domain-containing protein n=2 Tax=Bacillus thuringiensis TaxID=1428 RepID=A0A9W3VGJ3_BACTU|nr:HD-GYP domain-containing protein [Bacillus thuringiensis]AYF84831.1 HD-GYP domain-containing protein [Bacillus thuringiensis]
MVVLLFYLLGLKDPYTKEHSKRVAIYATILAKETKEYNQNSLNYLYHSCLLHDIGKMRIPNKILKKPSSLTKEEYDVMKSHPERGIQVVNLFPFLPVDSSIILSHHEKWDGSGYPNGLKKQEISLSARIVAIADAFDAMTSTRMYRTALTPKEAYNQIIEGTGTQFDPELVTIFQKVFASWIKIIPKEVK